MEDTRDESRKLVSPTEGEFGINRLALVTFAICAMLVPHARGEDRPSRASKSYIISEKNPMFCEGGRFLLQARKSGLHITCDDRARVALTIVGVDNVFVVGVTIMGQDTLEDIAKYAE